MNSLKVTSATPERKAAYLEEQKRIAQPFIKRGGASQRLGEEREEEALRVVSLSGDAFEDYVNGWQPLATTPAKPPCSCGNLLASWRGDRHGLRQWLCDKCWKEASRED